MLSILAESLLIATRIEPFRSPARPTGSAAARRAEVPRRKWFHFAAEA